MWFLAGLPSKLKVLVDRLTSARAANLDNLNATVSSRAPASTALSNAVWTDTRAGKLDSIERAVVSRSPTNLVYFQTYAPYTAVGTYNVVNISGAGVLNYCAMRLQAGTGNSGNGYLKVTIDGVVVVNRYCSINSGGDATFTVVGSWNSTTGISALDSVPFNSSLLIQIIHNSGLMQASPQYIYRTT